MRRGYVINVFPLFYTIFIYVLLDALLTFPSRLIFIITKSPAEEQRRGIVQI